MAVAVLVGAAGAANAAIVSWSTNMIVNTLYTWNNAAFWDAGVPVAGDDVFMTNAIAGSRTIQNDVLSINLANFTMNWNSANTGTFNLSGAAGTTNYFAVTGTTIIGNNAVFNLNPNSSNGGAFMTNNNLYLVGNSQMRLATEARGQTVVVTGSFSNSPTSLFLSAGRNDGRLVFTTPQAVTNNGTMEFLATATGASSLPQISIAETNKLINKGTVRAFMSSGATTQVNPALTLFSEFDNQGTLIATNNSNGRVTLRVVGRSGSAVTNSGRWVLVGVGSRAQNVIALGNFVNRGSLTFEVAGSIATNLFTLSEAGAVFRNDLHGQFTVLGGTNAVLADRIVNAGTNTIQTLSALFLYNSAGTATNVLENAGRLQVDGRLLARTVTNQSGGVISGNGTIVANILSLSGSYIVPGSSIGTNSVTGNVSIGDGATLQIELGSNPGENDLLAITGGLTLGATSILDLSGGVASLVYTVATFNASSLVGTFGTVTPGYSVTYNNSGGVITVELLNLVPEPGTAILLAGGLLGLWLHRRNKKYH